jgi:uncharacterized membrane protein YhaH (DUF805 family)
MTTTTTDTPLRGATFGQAFSRFWQRFATFSGRASLSEFWWAALIVEIPSLALYLLGISAGPLFWLAGVWSVATIIPSLAITWRRLHDTNRSGANWFWVLLPFVGWIILLVQLLGQGNPAGERFDAK